MKSYVFQTPNVQSNGIKYHINILAWEKVPPISNTAHTRNGTQSRLVSTYNISELI